MTSSTSNAKAQEDLTKRAVPDLGGAGAEGVDRAREIFRWAESEALSLHAWYLAEKKGKALASKITRVFSIVMLTLGASFPTLALLTDKWVRPEWGYIALAAGGGAVVLDRTFGFSASWTRYMTTAAALGRSIAKVQAEWILWRAKGSDDLEVLIGEVIAPFFDEVNEIVEIETGEWASVFGENLSELHSALADPKA
ncbi:SLATT domain-containing protein [Streptomyces sp. DSM 41033]|uniref:SLATT domain-containing protein n=1 Tax=Streptomyces sp. DSM 41033 TaxID=3448655 RepID=UPI0040400F67